MLLGRSLPLAPVGGSNFDLLLGLRVDPSVKDTAARKSERVHTIIIDHGQFKVPVKRRGRYGRPFHAANYVYPQGARFDLDHSPQR